MNKCSGIYRIELGNEHFYIGSAVDLDRRKREHCREMKRGVHPNKIVQHCWNKYGVFEFTVLEECEIPELLATEQVWIDKHFADPKNANLSPTAGSPLGRECSAETRAKMSATRKGVPRSAETRAKMSVAKQNVSAETRAKISAVHKGLPHSAETRAKMSKPKSAETRAKMSIAQQNKSAETRAKMSIAQQIRWKEKKARNTDYVK